MIRLEIHLDGDNAWPDLRERLDEIIQGDLVGVARLKGGTTSGNSTVGFRIHLPDGRVVFAETTLALLRGAMAAFEAREAQEQGQPPPAGDVHAS